MYGDNPNAKPGKQPVVTAGKHEQLRQQAEDRAHAQAAQDIRNAGAQRAGYVSQGKAVEKAANQQKAAVRTRQAQVKDTKAASDMGRAAAYVRSRWAGGKTISVATGKPVAPPTVQPEEALKQASKLTLGDSKLRNAQRAAVLSPQHGSDPWTIAKNAARGVIDTYANAVPSVYHLGQAAVTGHPGQVAHMLTDPYVQAFKHPGQALTEHPFQTALLFGGAKGAVGGTAGRIMRAAPSKTVRALASTERAAKTLPGTRVTQEQSYSKNVIKKAEQKTVENLQARRAARKGQPPPNRMTQKDVQRRVDEEVQAAKIIGQQHAGTTQKAAQKAVGKKPTAATNLAAQGVTTGTHADLHAYLIELERHAQHLTGDELKANEVTQQHIHAALKGHDEQRVQAAAAAYSAHRAPLEQQAIGLGLVKPAAAEATRLAPIAVRRFGTSAEAMRAAKTSTREARVVAERAARGAGKDVVKAEQGLQRARANARVSVARQKKSPVLQQAEQTQREAVRTAARLKQTTSQRAGRTAAQADVKLARAVGDARVAVAKGSRSTALSAVERQHRQAVGDLGRLKRQYRGKPYTIEMGVGMKNARDAVRQAEQALKTEQRRIRGVPPAQHDALLRAIAARDEARQGVSRAVSGADVAKARAAARAAGDAVKAERARISGVAPVEADALRKALAGKETARTGASAARATRTVAVAAHRAVKKAPFVSAQGEPVTIQTIRQSMNGQVEPAFVSHSGARGRTAALPVDRPSIPTKEQRTGEAVRKGTIDAHPAALVEQSVRTQALIDAAESRNRFLKDFGYRAGKNVENYRTQKKAELAIPAAKAATGGDWVPMQHGDGSYVLVPKTAKQRLAAHEQKVAQHPVLKAVGSQWRRNVLAFSPKWLAGNTLEAALRSVVAGAGPRSFVTAKRSIKALEQTDPLAAEQLRARALSGGQYRTAQRVARTPMGEDLGRLAKSLQKVRQTHGPKEIADAYGHYTQLVFNTLNGRLETQFQTAMLGKALRDSPLMSGHVVKISQKAAQDAAKGLKNTNAQVALGREVDRMYGQYGKFSPGLRQTISTYTPFAAWTLNATKFLTSVLPRDHPVITSLIASANQATEQWRKDHGLVADLMHANGMVPGWLQGSIPGKDGSHLRVSRFTPFGLIDNEGNNPIGGIPGLLLPQFAEIAKNLQGQNWQGHPLSTTNPSGARDLVAAAAAFFEGQIPAAAQALNVAGVRTPNVADSTKIKQGVALRGRSQFDPFMYTPGTTTPAASGGGVVVKVAPVKVKPVKIKPIVVR